MDDGRSSVIEMVVDNSNVKRNETFCLEEYIVSSEIIYHLTTLIHLLSTGEHLAIATTVTQESFLRHTFIIPLIFYPSLVVEYKT